MQRGKIRPNSLKAKQCPSKKGKNFPFVDFGSSRAMVVKKKF